MTEPTDSQEAWEMEQAAFRVEQPLTMFELGLLKESAMYLKRFGGKYDFSEHLLEFDEKQLRISNTIKKLTYLQNKLQEEELIPF